MADRPLHARPFFHRVTEGIRVTVRPRFVPEQSRPGDAHHVFAYQVRLENVGSRPAQLISRHWRIHDQDGDELQVEGAGVVGAQPMIPAGGVYEYQSFCVLRSPRGWMEGSYRFVRPDGSTFDAQIPRFDLEA